MKERQIYDESNVWSITERDKMMKFDHNKICSAV